MIDRWYVRCPGCLSSMMVEVDLAEMEPRCEACDTRLQIVGRVRHQHWVRTGLETPCDARCTGATGSKCNCACGGKNHGSHAVVEVVCASGKAVVRVLHREVALLRLAEYREAYDQLLGRIEERYPELQQRARGAWVENWSRLLAGQRWYDRLLETKAMKTHHGRMTRIAELRREFES